jgi:enamine deaminase RidA (YjgF/YER057c/UK114 family)
MASFRPIALTLAIALSTAAFARPADQDEEEEKTQVLELPKEPPQAVVAETQRLVFYSSPLSSKGLLSQQVRDGLKALFRSARRAQIVKIRAFVAGSGDMRRVQTIVSEEFTEKRRNIPAVTVVQVGALPLVGAQVLLEATAVERKDVNPHGVAFVAGRPVPAPQAADHLVNTLAKAGLQPDATRRVTCYLHSLENLKEVRSGISAKFPKAPATFVQIRRVSYGDTTECEAVAALSTPPSQTNGFVRDSRDPDAQVAMVGPGKIALTGAQLGFGKEEADVRLAFDRLGKALESVGASWDSVAMFDTYALTTAIADKVRTIKKELIDQENPPGSTIQLFEGLPSLDALVAIDTVAVVTR